MRYGLGVDLGTTFTAVALGQGGHVEMVGLGERTVVTPSVVFAREGAPPLIGDAAVRRELGDPARAGREFKRRLGDPSPMLLGETAYSPTMLMATLLRDVLGKTTALQGEPPERLVLTHPAVWGPYRREQFAQVPRLCGLDDVTIVTEPVAAATYYTNRRPLAEGDVVAVYDLGGGTFDATVVRMHEGVMQILGEPEGLEWLGGIDFDETIFAFLDRALDGRVGALDPRDPQDAIALFRLRQECVVVKEALSVDDEVTIQAFLPDGPAQARLTRTEFEGFIRPAVVTTVEAVHRALKSAQVAPADLASVLLVGGSSRIPLVAQLLEEELGRPTVVDAHPKHAVALGAAIVADQVVRTGSGQAPVLDIRSSTGDDGQLASFAPSRSLTRATAPVPPAPPRTPRLGRRSRRPAAAAPSELPSVQAVSSPPAPTAPEAPASQAVTTDSLGAPRPTPHAAPPPTTLPTTPPEIRRTTDPQTLLPHDPSASPVTGPLEPHASGPVAPDAPGPETAPTRPGRPLPGGARPAGAPRTSARPTVSEATTPRGAAEPGRTNRRPGPRVTRTGAVVVAVLVVMSAVGLATTLLNRPDRPPAAARPTSATGSTPSPGLIRPPVVRRVVRPLGDRPQGAAFSADGKRLYVASVVAGTVSVLDTADDAVVTTITLPVPPQYVVADPNRPRVYVTLIDPKGRDSALAEIDTRSNTLVRRIPVGASPLPPALAPDGSQVWVPDRASSQIQVVDLASGQVVRKIDVPGLPSSVAFGPGGKRAYVTNFNTEQLSVYEPDTGQVVSRLRVGVTPIATTVSADGRLVAVANYDSGSVSLIDAATARVRSTVTVGAGPQSVAFSPDSARLFVANTGAGTLSTVDVTTGRVAGTTPVGSEPWWVATAPDGRTIYAVSAGDDSATALTTG